MNKIKPKLNSKNKIRLPHGFSFFWTKNQAKKGVTLIELAIVITVISLIISGILYGKDLQRNAEINTLLAEMQKFTATTLQFQTTYSGLPGDFRRASQYWGGSATNGNGNGNIEIETSNEAFSAFRHLSLAELIDGSYSGTWSGAFASKTNIFASKSGNSALIYLGCCGTSVGTLKFRNYVNAFIANSTTRAAVISPVEAMGIDKKIDDGIPDYGMFGAAGTGCFTGVGTSSVYGAGEERKCQIYLGYDN
jgi:prepilin-type N-terminal cleavage/methylation domain-containing protein